MADFKWKASAVQNQDLWRALDDLVSEHLIRWVWVAGHADHIAQNRCDAIVLICTWRLWSGHAGHKDAAKGGCTAGILSASGARLGDGPKGMRRPRGF